MQMGEWWNGDKLLPCLPVAIVPDGCLRGQRCSGYLRPSYRVVVAAEPDLTAAGIEHHVPDRAAAARNGGDPEEFLGLGIESHQAVGLRPGLHQPDPVFVVRVHGIRKSGWTTRQGPLLELLRCGIEPAEEAPGVINVPHAI